MALLLMRYRIFETSLIMTAGFGVHWKAVHTKKVRVFRGTPLVMSARKNHIERMQRPAGWEGSSIKPMRKFDPFLLGSFVFSSRFHLYKLPPPPTHTHTHTRIPPLPLQRTKRRIEEKKERVCVCASEAIVTARGLCDRGDIAFTQRGGLTTCP